MVWRPPGVQVLAVDQQNVRPAIAIEIEESAAGAQWFPADTSSRQPGVVDEVDSRLRRHIGELYRHSWRRLVRGDRQRTEGKRNFERMEDFHCLDAED